MKRDWTFIRRRPNAFDCRGSYCDRRAFLAAGAAAVASFSLPASALAQSIRGNIRPEFKRVAPQYIAALAAPDATAGGNAERWGLWRQDPGPRGVRLSFFDRLEAAGGVAPAEWRFDSHDWWLEEHGLIMEQPEFPLPPGRYVVTGARAVTAVLTVHPREADGAQHWELADGATVYDVTHLRCRSARYTPAAGAGGCTPAQAKQSDFPVRPGAEMPPVENCAKQDYAVLIVIGVAVDNA